MIRPGVRPGAAAPPAPLSPEERRRLLRSEGAIQASDPAIAARARELVPKGTAPVDAARRINRWVHEHLRYEVTPESLEARAILDRARGDCTEYSTLAVALLRASGIPAELREGMAIAGGELVAHSWVAFHDGTGWREMDPTFGRDAVGSGHVEASVLDFIALLSIDCLKVVSVAPAGRREAPAGPGRTGAAP